MRLYKNTTIAGVGLAALALACSPVNQEQYDQVKGTSSPRYCFFQALVDDSGKIRYPRYVQDTEPLQKWDELLCTDADPPYFIGITLPSNTWRGLDFSMEGINREIAEYQNKYPHWKRLESWMGKEDNFFAGFLIVTDKKPPQPGQSVYDSPEYKQLVTDLYEIVDRNVKPKEDKGIII